jgi:hypothetical protein
MILSSNSNYIWKHFNINLYTCNFFGVVNCIIFFILNELSSSCWKGFFIHENKFNTHYNILLKLYEYQTS